MREPLSEDWTDAYPDPLSVLDAAAIDQGTFDIEQATMRDLRRQGECATRIAALLSEFGGAIVARAFEEAARGEARSPDAGIRHNCNTCKFSGSEFRGCELLTMDDDNDIPICGWLNGPGRMRGDGSVPEDAEGCPGWVHRG